MTLSEVQSCSVCTAKHVYCKMTVTILLSKKLVFLFLFALGVCGSQVSGCIPFQFMSPAQIIVSPTEKDTRRLSRGVFCDISVESSRWLEPLVLSASCRPAARSGR